MRKYLNSSTLCASLVSSVFSTIFAIAELIMGLGEEASALNAKTAILTAASYFGYFLITFWVIVLCYEIVRKFIDVKILSAAIAFILYFALETLMLFFSTIAFKFHGDMALTLLDYVKIRIASGQYVFSLQFFAIAYAFYRIFTLRKKS